MKKRVALIWLCLVVTFSLLGCRVSNRVTPQVDNGEPLTIYCGSETSRLQKIIDAYNRSAEKIDQLEIVPYTGDDGTAIATELMSGKGPDLFLFAPYAFVQLYPIMDEELFQDLNPYFEKNGISLDDYNRNIIDEGVYHEKRMYIPCWYSTGFFLTTEERLEQYGIPTDITINNTDYTNLMPYLDAVSMNHMTLFDMAPSMEFLATDYVDYNNQTTSFLSDGFRNLVQQQKEILSHPGGQGGQDSIFTSGLASGLSGAMYQLGAPSTQDEKYILIPETTKGGGEMAYLVNGSVAISANSPNGDRAFKFIQWLTSEQTQCDTTMIPITCDAIHKKAFDTRIDQLPALSTREKDILQQYRELNAKITGVTNIDGSFYTTIFYPLWTQYLEDSITLDDFISQLNDKSKLYFKERK